MSKKQFLVLLISLLLAALWLVGCRDTVTTTPIPPTATARPPTPTPRPTHTPTPTPTPSPLELLQAADASLKNSTYRYEMELVEILSGAQLEQDVEVNIRFLADFQPPDRTQLSMMVLDGTSELETRLTVIGSTSYIQNPFTGKWHIQAHYDLPFDPAELTMDVSDIQDLQLLEQVTLAGVPAYHLTGRSVLPMTLDEPLGEAQVDMAVEYWISQADSLLLQSTAAGQIDFTGEYALVVDVTMTMRLFDYNVPLEISAPEVEFPPESLIGRLLPPLAAEDAQAYLERGLVSFEDDRPGLAAAYFTRAIELDPELSDAYLYRGLALAVMEEDYRAPDDIGQYLSMHPEDAQAYVLRAQFPTYGHGKTPSDACADANTALQLSPDLPEALTMQALCTCTDPEAGPDRLEQAFALFAQARAIDAERVDPFYANYALRCFESLNYYDEVESIEEILPQIDADIAAHPELPGGYLVRAVVILWLTNDTIEQTVNAWSDVFRYLQRGDCGVHPQMYNGFDRQDLLSAARHYIIYQNCYTIDRLFDDIWDDEIDLSGVDASMAADPQFKADFEQFQQEVQAFSMVAIIPEYLNSVEDASLIPAGLISDGSLVATRAYRVVQFWDLDGAPLGMHQFEGHLGASAFSPDGRLLVTGYDSSDVALWEVSALSASLDDQPEALRYLEFPNEVVGADDQANRLDAIAFSADGSRVAAALRSGACQVWSVETGEPLHPFTLTVEVESIALPAQGDWIAVAYGETAGIFDIETGEQLFQLGEPPGEGIYGAGKHFVALSPDERLIAAAGRGNPEVTVWDSATGELVFSLAGYFSGGGPLAFSPDSRLLAAAGNDGVVRIWDMHSGALLHLVGHRGGSDLSTFNYQVWVAAFSPDGRTLLTGGEDGTSRLWDVQTGAELAIIRVVELGE